MNEYKINVRGTNTIDDQSDTIEISAVGQFEKRGDSFYISYPDSESFGSGDVYTTVEVQGNDRVILSRAGDINSQLVLERNTRHTCLYDTGLNQLTMGVFGEDIENSLTEKGGEVRFKYALDMNTFVTTENEVYISVKSL